MKRLTKAAVIASLGELAAQPFDGESLHSAADDLLLDYVPDDVREAYEAVVASSDFWAFA